MVRTGGPGAKFGIPEASLGLAVSAAKAAGAVVVGLHAHSGSGILDPDHWQYNAERLVDLSRSLPDLRILDLGGGLGVPDRWGGAKLDLSALDRAVGRVRRRIDDVELWLEPGRYLVADAGVLLARVTQTKEKGERRFVGVATGMNSLIRPALYGAYHEVVNLSRLGNPETELVTVVGPICESGDRLAMDRLLPPTQEGDVILVAQAGAYGRVMSSSYNLRPPADEIALA
jgi:diaminopimelate decarboxylase/aspartate kinase